MSERNKDASQSPPERDEHKQWRPPEPTSDQLDYIRLALESEGTYDPKIIVGGPRRA